MLGQAIKNNFKTFEVVFKIYYFLNIYLLYYSLIIFTGFKPRRRYSRLFLKKVFGRMDVKHKTFFGIFLSNPSAYSFGKYY